MRNNFLLILLFCSLYVFADVYELTKILDEALLTNEDYLQAKIRLEKEEAEAGINSSLRWLDVNLSYGKYSNDITRDETKTTLEQSNISEEDERRKIELSRRFFPKDFDDSSDVISSKIDLMRFRQNYLLTKTDQTDEILSDCIDYNSDVKMKLLLFAELEKLKAKNSVLEELNAKNLIKPQRLIKNIKDIEKLEDKLLDLQQNITRFRYLDFYQEITEKLSQIQVDSAADTVRFNDKIIELTKNTKKAANKINSGINLRKAFFFLPEITVSLSYNQRTTSQDWVTVENQTSSQMLRNIEEEFPEAEVEMSLPFNIISNTKGKKKLLNAYENELKFRSANLNWELQDFREGQILSYNKRQNEYSRKKRLNELYKVKHDTANEQYDIEPDILGENAEEKLYEIQTDSEKAEIEFEAAKQKLQKEIFLINTFGE